jgi:ergothioneine biosynthesis protein EgtC
MCRFTLYLGPELRLSTLLLEPEHSLIRQSTHSREREEPLNGDGFGVGWYAPALAAEPAVFRSITPAWNNRNLRNLARVVSSGCILAHVRAATQSSGVNEANCHPFRFQRWLLMHNGDVGGFRQVRRRMLEDVCDAAYGNVFGSTDSEHFFAVVIDELLRRPGETGLARMAAALEAAIGRVLEIVARHGGGEPSFLNVALSDGVSAVISRYCNDPQSPPESLYCYEGQVYASLGREAGAGGSTLVSSERLTDDPAWQAVPPNHLVLLARGQAPRFQALLY